MKKNSTHSWNTYYLSHSVLVVSNVIFSLISPNPFLYGFGNNAIFCVPLLYLFMRIHATKFLHLENSIAGMGSEMIIMCPPVSSGESSIVAPVRMIQYFSTFCFFGNLVGISHSYYHGTSILVRILFAAGFWFVLMLTGYMAGARAAYNQRMNS